jgi:hypothetical protein
MAARALCCACPWRTRTGVHARRRRVSPAGPVTSNNKRNRRSRYDGASNAAGSTPFNAARCAHAGLPPPSPRTPGAVCRRRDHHRISRFGGYPTGAGSGPSLDRRGADSVHTVEARPPCPSRVGQPDLRRWQDRRSRSRSRSRSRWWPACGHSRRGRLERAQHRLTKGQLANNDRLCPVPGHRHRTQLGHSAHCHAADRAFRLDRTTEPALMGWLQGVAPSRDAGAAPLVGTRLRRRPLLPMCGCPMIYRGRSHLWAGALRLGRGGLRRVDGWHGCW